jgi:D-3-phosphoglycerate dehydrogenase
LYEGVKREDWNVKLYVSTDPFSSTSVEPLNLLKYNGFEYRFNCLGRKMTSDELAEDIGEAEVLIAGTEKISRSVLEKAPNLKLISRVGIGLDGIDFDLCREYEVRVAYTPDAPTIAVAELTVGLILDCARKITETNDNLKSQGVWRRHMGGLLNGKSVGLFGMGRIGKSIIHLLSGFNVEFLVHDVNPDIAFARLHKVKLVEKSDVLKYSDIVSIHLPLKADTKNYIEKEELSLMQQHATLINTARGGIVNETALFDALTQGRICGAAVDVFESEPYQGPLRGVKNCLLTCHMGASTVESRADMEIQAVEEAVRFKKGLDLKNEVYDNV